MNYLSYMIVNSFLILLKILHSKINILLHKAANLVSLEISGSLSAYFNVVSSHESMIPDVEI